MKCLSNEFVILVRVLSLSSVVYSVYFFDLLGLKVENFTNVKPVNKVCFVLQIPPSAFEGVENSSSHLASPKNLTIKVMGTKGLLLRGGGKKAATGNGEASAWRLKIQKANP